MRPAVPVRGNVTGYSKLSRARLQNELERKSAEGEGRRWLRENG